MVPSPGVIVMRSGVVADTKDGSGWLTNHAFQRLFTNNATAIMTNSKHAILIYFSIVFYLSAKLVKKM